ncbi:phospholipase B1, membrane-associated-like [Photinus pyralis]|nr:phospholipase B1, membrane-associated-like [Photinus pyralis]
MLQYPQRKSHVRKQPTISKSTQFPCANSTGIGKGRSETVPTSVHKLRPGDIDIIAAMGDSLIAGSGAMEEWALGNMIEYRGLSWCIGGEHTWRTYLTLPNILKEFNPNLTGYSTGTGELLSRHSRLNVAFPVAADADALMQAKALVARLKKLKLNLNESWKMITFFFGANDLCSAQCFNADESSPERHAQKLMIALDYLQKHLPKTFVNLIPVLDVSVSLRVRRSFMCKLMHRLYCTCFHRGGSNPMYDIPRLARDYQRAEFELVESGRYEKNDFTVVLQPFIKLFNAPADPRKLYDEAIDISYITHDCFHFSQKGHALAANMLWNNLLQPVGRKSINNPGNIMENFQCPSSRAPYLFTKTNSQQYLSTGFQ